MNPKDLAKKNEKIEKLNKTHTKWCSKHQVIHLRTDYASCRYPNMRDKK